MRKYTPDKWVIIQVDKIYKVLGGWSGGYTDPDNWRLSSGVKNIEEEDDKYLVHNHSGSVYECRKGCEGMTGLSSAIYGQIEELCKKDDKELKILEEGDYEELKV